jgi:hypothetical protein
MRKSLLSTVTGIVTAILAANLLHTHAGLNVWAVVIGLISGLEVGYWSYDWKLSAKIHKEFLLIPTRIPLRFYLFLVAFASVFLAAYLAIQVYEWFGLSMGADFSPRWDESGAEGISFLFSWMYDDGNALGMAFGFFALLSSAFLSIFVSTESFEHETDPVRRGMAFVWITIGSVAIGLSITFVGMVVVWLFMICLVIVVACIAVAIIGGTLKLASMSQLASITVGVTIGAVFGLAYGWTNMQFEATLIACSIGATSGCASAYTVCQIGKTRAFQDAWESVTW